MRDNKTIALDENIPCFWAFWNELPKLKHFFVVMPKLSKLVVVNLKRMNQVAKPVSEQFCNIHSTNSHQRKINRIRIISELEFENKRLELFDSTHHYGKTSSLKHNIQLLTGTKNVDMTWI